MWFESDRKRKWKQQQYQQPTIQLNKENKWELPIMESYSMPSKKQLRFLSFS